MYMCFVRNERDSVYHSICFQPEAINRAIDEALGHFKKIDILINSECLSI